MKSRTLWAAVVNTLNSGPWERQTLLQLGREVLIHPLYPADAALPDPGIMPCKTLLLDDAPSLEGDGVRIVETGGQVGIMQFYRGECSQHLPGP